MILKLILEKIVSIVKIWTFVSKLSHVNDIQFSEILKPQKNDLKISLALQACFHKGCPVKV